MIRIILIGTVFLLSDRGFINADKPCAVRKISNRSVVCVCNETYCDEIKRDAPEQDSFIAYSTSEAGSRFKKTKGKLEEIGTKMPYILKLDPSTHYQTIEGFGGAVTDAAAINWKNLTMPLQNYLIQSYFSNLGIEYNMIRVPIGGTDFSTRPYAYNELPTDDYDLSNFTLTDEDDNYKIPMIKLAISVSTAPIYIVATTWSPPPWMKTNNAYRGFNQLLERHYQTYALYHYKFLECYAKNGINVWAVTTTNEPTNGILYGNAINCLGWFPFKMGKWIAENLGPTLKNSTFRDVKILAVDDQRYDIPVMFNMMLREQPKARGYISGVAVHFYGDAFTPAAVLDEVSTSYPDMFILATEACAGSFPWERKVDIGSWKRGVSYVTSIISDLNHNIVGWIDWNLCLNEHGGPNWCSNFVDSPVLVFPEKKEFIKQPMFYATGHFSKFVLRGSKRIKTVERKCFFKCTVQNVAFATPRNTVVVVLYNSGAATGVALRLGKTQASLELEAHSITTVEIPYNPTLEDKNNK